ncbi:hypothetical protein [Planctomyces sp. SH-PL62]|uniref:hypothetical protein n=1 Tax=Planctomyces sp. SH-PL62 TaxID=1636152 RepID=UPI00078B6321|nr:hypothetical protein [Planctomyces sp. SH-PL62]AMV38079.1 hypothetical protein VT85_11620 [Planctomyces sp. SH-PL62]
MAIETVGRNTEAGATGPTHSHGGVVRALFAGEFPAWAFFPHPAPVDLAAAEDSRRDGPVVGFCRVMELRSLDPEGEGWRTVAERVAGADAFADRPGLARVLAASWGLGLAQARLAAAVAKVRGDERLARSPRAGAALARLAAGSYALRASTVAAASWLDRGVADAVDTAFLGPFVSRIDAPAIHDETTDEALDLLAAGGLGDADPSPGGAGPSAPFWPTLAAHIRRSLARSASPPRVPVATPMLRPFGEALSRRTSHLGRVVERIGARDRHDESFRDRVALAAVELIASACTLARLDAASARPDEQAVAELFLHESGRRFDEALRSIARDPDREAVEAGRLVLRRSPRT